MKIPKRFTLGPHEIKVHIVSATEMKKVCDAISVISGEDEEETPPWGLFIRGENAIFLQKIRVGLCAQQQLHTFWHEFYHALFATLNRDLTDDEMLVDQCGLLHLQMQQSAKY